MTDPADTGGPPPLDPGLLAAIRPSAGKLAAAGDQVVQLLHSEIADLVGDLPGQGWGFCERMAGAILWIILGGQPPEEVAEGLRWLGSVNQEEGFPATEYVSVGHALVRVVRHVSAGGWVTTTGSAWSRFFMWMRPCLEASAYQVAAEQEAARLQAAEEREAQRREAFDQVARDEDSADVDVSVVSDLLDDEDSDGPDPGYDQIMMDMTPKRRRQLE